MGAIISSNDATYANEIVSKNLSVGGNLSVNGTSTFNSITGANTNFNIANFNNVNGQTGTFTNLNTTNLSTTSNINLNGDIIGQGNANFSNGIITASSMRIQNSINLKGATGPTYSLLTNNGQLCLNIDNAQVGCIDPVKKVIILN